MVLLLVGIMPIWPLILLHRRVWLYYVGPILGILILQLLVSFIMMSYLIHYGVCLMTKCAIKEISFFFHHFNSLAILKFGLKIL